MFSEQNNEMRGEIAMKTNNDNNRYIFGIDLTKNDDGMIEISGEQENKLRILLQKTYMENIIRSELEKKHKHFRTEEEYWGLIEKVIEKNNDLINLSNKIEKKILTDMENILNNKPIEKKVFAYTKQGIALSLSNFMISNGKGYEEERKEFKRVVNASKTAEETCRNLDNHKWTYVRFNPYKTIENGYIISATDYMGNVDYIKITEGE